jgi:hypothetical protein
MKLYAVQNDEGIAQRLEVAAETDLGYHVRISVESSPPMEYRDFISRILFETLLKTGTLEPLAPEAQAG